MCFSFPFVYLKMSLFPSIFCTIPVFSLYGEYVVRSFLPDGVFLLYDHGLDLLFDISLCENSINRSINQSKVLFSYSRWSFVDVPLYFSCPADHALDWQPRI